MGSIFNTCTSKCHSTVCFYYFEMAVTQEKANFCVIGNNSECAVMPYCKGVNYLYSKAMIGALSHNMQSLWLEREGFFPPYFSNSKTGITFMNYFLDDAWRIEAKKGWFRHYSLCSEVTVKKNKKVRHLCRGQDKCRDHLVLSRACIHCSCALGSLNLAEELEKLRLSSPNYPITIDKLVVGFTHMRKMSRLLNKVLISSSITVTTENDNNLFSSESTLPSKPYIRSN